MRLVRANSLLDAAGKDKLIDERLTDSLIDEVANGDDKRFLYVGVVDLHSGRFLRIDKVKLARTIKPLRLHNACYCLVIGASSAFSIAFPRKFIDDRMLVDGGARRHLFITGLPNEATQPNIERRPFSLVHGDLDVGCSDTSNEVLKIAARSVSLSVDQGFKDSIRLTGALAREPARLTGHIQTQPKGGVIEL